MLLFLPLFALLQMSHWFGFLLDELFFRSYRKVEINKPVFVSGVPRSGTTMVHRTLALDTQFTTLSTWECLFAPSISQRRLIRLIARADGWIGRPLGRMSRWCEQRAFGGLGDVHGMSLADAEEDYFVFMPVLSCFILVVPFPYAQWLWDIGEFDRRVDPAQRQRLMTYYRRCVQKHLYASGPGKRFLSKNASFPPLLGSLATEFPDARFVFCLRDPLEVVPSQLSSLRSGMEFFCNDPYDFGFRDKMIDQLDYYYRNLIETPIPDEQRAWIKMNQFKPDLSVGVENIYKSLGLAMSDEYRKRLATVSDAARDYCSAHDYRLDEFGLDAASLRARFADTIAELELGPATNTGASV
ncbi:MAG: sulfotransferase [Gammaproteobacteria bacterium]|nr:sulfotransferase [Gammaproteobacteria bacterium]